MTRILADAEVQEIKDALDAVLLSCLNLTLAHDIKQLHDVRTIVESVRSIVKTLEVTGKQ